MHSFQYATETVWHGQNLWISQKELRIHRFTRMNKIKGTQREGGGRNRTHHNTKKKEITCNVLRLNCLFHWTPKSFMYSAIVCMTQQLHPSLQFKPFFCVDTLNFFYVIFYASLHSTRGYRLHLMDFDHFLSSSWSLVNNRRQLNDSDVINRGWCINEISHWSEFFCCWYLLRFQAQPHYSCFFFALAS